MRLKHKKKVFLPLASQAELLINKKDMCKWLIWFQSAVERLFLESDGNHKFVGKKNQTLTVAVHHKLLYF